MTPENPPAFPAPNFAVPYDLEQRHVAALGETQGMTLRDYFAAHAPSEPQAWFEPLLSRPYPQRPARPDLHPDTARILDSWLGDPTCDFDALDQRVAPRDFFAVSEFVGAMKNFWKVQAELDAEAQVERLRQWPYAWADMMLTQRAKGSRHD